MSTNIKAAINRSKGDIDKLISSLPDLPVFDGIGLGGMCYLYNIMGANIVKHEYLLVTGELVECHKGLINIGDMQDVREHLREDLYYNVIEFIGVGYCHRRTP